MKKTIVLLLSCAMLCVTAACSPQNSSEKGSDSAPDTTAAEVSTEPATEAPVSTFTNQMKAKVDSLMGEYEYEGSAYLTQNGTVVWQYANGKDVSGNAMTVDTPLPIGSVSKQFCAAAIMTLRDSGKLSLDDTLDTYFPAWADGKKLTIRNLLTMRSGISDVVNDGAIDGVTETNTYEQNRKAVQEAIFEMSLTFDPDTRYEYSNSNYILLSAIVEQTSGQTYIEYLRSSLLEPMGMSHTGSLDELRGASPMWANGLDYSYIIGLSTGAGDIVSAASDMDKWMNGLRDGTALSSDSYREMTTDYSADSGTSYGYGFMLDFKNGLGHPGNILIGETPYAAFDYFSEEYGYNLILEGSDCMDVAGLGVDILNVLYQ